MHCVYYNYIKVQFRNSQISQTRTMSKNCILVIKTYIIFWYLAKESRIQNLNTFLRSIMHQSLGMTFVLCPSALTNVFEIGIYNTGWSGLRGDSKMGLPDCATASYSTRPRRTFSESKDGQITRDSKRNQKAKIKLYLGYRSSHSCLFNK
jgi:hypothetical protein